MAFLTNALRTNNYNIEKSYAQSSVWRYKYEKTERETGGEYQKVDERNPLSQTKNIEHHNVEKKTES
jgi:hypothetical protein